MKLKEKINLILECLEVTGKPITQKTEYKGQPIGVMLANIKNTYHKGTISYQEEEISRLREKGLLEPKREKVIDIAKRVIEYVRKNPRLWYLKKADLKAYVCTIKDERLRDQIMREYEDIERKYRYLVQRKKAGKLDKSIIEMLTQAGVDGKTFGYPEETTVFAQKTGLPGKTAQLILMEVGGLDSFRKEFVELMIDRDVQEHTRLVQIIELINELARKEQRQPPFIQGFDMTQPNFIPSINDVNFLRALDNNDSTIYGYFVNESEILHFINEAFQKENGIEIIERHFGLNGYSPQTQRSIARLMGCTHAAIFDRVNRFLNKLEVQRRSYSSLIAEAERRSFIEKFFDNNHIFIEGTELSEETKKALSSIYEEGLQAKKEEESQQLVKGEQIKYIMDLGLKKTTFRALFNAGYVEAAQLLALKNEKDLLKIKGIGERLLQDLRAKMHACGFYFKWEEPGIHQLFDTMFCNTTNPLDTALSEKIQILVLKWQMLKEEQAECIKLGKELDKEKQRELQLLEQALNGEEMEL